MHRVRLDRCAYGSALVAAGGGTFSFVSLFNEGASQAYLAVRDFGGLEKAIATAFGFLVASGSVGTLVSAGQPVVSNGPALGGSIYSGQVASLPVATLYGSGAALNAGWPHDFPFIVLPPNYSLTAYASSNSTALNFGFWWELLWPDQKINPWIGDPDIDE